MKSLLEILNEGIFDVDKNIDSLESQLILKWIDSISSNKKTVGYGHNHKNKFVINKDLSVSYDGDLYLDICVNGDGNLQEVTEIPDYINFDTIEGNFSIKMYTINKMQKNQFPKEIKKTLFIKGNDTTLKDVHICAKDVIIRNCGLFSKIDNVEFEFAPNGHLNLSESSLTIDEFKKIKFVNGNLRSIDCTDTPMSETIFKTRNKLIKKEDREGFRTFMKEFVPKSKLPELIEIKIKSKRYIKDVERKDWWVLTDQYGKWIVKK